MLPFDGFGDGLGVLVEDEVVVVVIEGLTGTGAACSGAGDGFGEGLVDVVEVVVDETAGACTGAATGFGTAGAVSL